jgi:hypothetical protein
MNTFPQTEPNPRNIAYWLSHGLDPDEVQVLWQVKMGVQPFRRNTLEIAYLIALGCVTTDLDREELTITEKGLDALSFFRDTLH